MIDWFREKGKFEFKEEIWCVLNEEREETRFIWMSLRREEKEKENNI